MNEPNTDDPRLENMRQAFAWIAFERSRTPGVPLEELIRRAATLHHLTPSQASWVRWSLEPEVVAVQPKEPAP
jgi:hypothetical protein